MGRDLNSCIPGAPNFKYIDFIKSDTAIRKGISNTPTEEHWKSIEILAVKVLQPIRNKFGAIRITSGYRSVELCEAVGSNSASNHPRGEAADIEPLDSKVKLIDICKFIIEELDFRELILEYFPEGWIHVAYREGGNEKVIKLKDKNHNYVRMTWDGVQKFYPV